MNPSKDMNSVANFQKQTYHKTRSPTVNHIFCTFVEWIHFGDVFLAFCITLTINLIEKQQQQLYKGQNEK